MPRRARTDDDEDEGAIASAPRVVEQATGASRVPTKSPKKNPHAQARSRLRASRGDKARANPLTEKRRAEIARKAVKARWGAAKKKLATRALWFAQNVDSETRMSYSKKAQANMREQHVTALDVRCTISVGQAQEAKYYGRWPTYVFEGLPRDGARVRVEFDVIESSGEVRILVSSVRRLR